MVFMPHYETHGKGCWKEICEQTGIEYLDPQSDDRFLLQRIRSAKLVLADAMHAAIAADTLRVPWVPVATSRQINSFKWIDWAASLEMPYEPVQLVASTWVEAIRSFCTRFYGECYLLRKNDEAAALVHYQYYQRLKSHPWWPYYCNTFRFVGSFLVRLFSFRSIVRPSPESSKSSDGAGARFHRAAESLLAASRRKPYLSRDEVFFERLHRMKAFLEEATEMSFGEKS